jgi:hypothetical protein
MAPLVAVLVAVVAATPPTRKVPPGVDQIFEGIREAFAGCAAAEPLGGASVRAAVVVYGDGRWSLGPWAFERELRAARLVRKLEPAPHGDLGDLCQLGEAAQAAEPDVIFERPPDCKPGLTCCSGGAAGSSGYCRAGDTCPLLP